MDTFDRMNDAEPEQVSGGNMKMPSGRNGDPEMPDAMVDEIWRNVVEAYPAAAMTGRGYILELHNAVKQGNPAMFIHVYEHLKKLYPPLLGCSPRYSVLNMDFYGNAQGPQ